MSLEESSKMRLDDVAGLKVLDKGANTEHPVGDPKSAITLTELPEGTRQLMKDYGISLGSDGELIGPTQSLFSAFDAAMCGEYLRFLDLVFNAPKFHALRDYGGLSPLHRAAYRGHYNSIKALLANGAGVDCLGDGGETPLIYASGYNGVTDGARLLISRGANVNAQDCKGNTALHRAAGNNNHQLVQFLLDSGAKSEWKNKEGQNAQEVASERGHKEVSEMICNVRVGR